ncbi:relaxase/mobilization nuclease-like protein [Dyadobacter jejuensis]|uniref:Relaxase/mobilization nuclease-like protein n=1 Tax=Dyadobacter jejuensis TaxID=1082580 RepID=A0A316A987_9BACT|nr:relaxase/mobilization nuclease domain-containing protein [Dyadobacter jejuensis]PWJ53424.1 relaxase/mobilization nuclease-like protein [Dyadobacter jejuensis]
MIARNLKAGKTSDGLLDYAFHGKESEHKDKGAEILQYSSDLLIPSSDKDKEGIKELKKEFNRRTNAYLKNEPDNKKALIGHQILSFTNEDYGKLKDDGLNKVLKDYIKLAKLDKTQFVAIKHNDTKNPHIHIIYHKIQNDLKKEKDWKLNNKTLERGIALALKHKLPLIDNQKKIALSRGVLEIRAKDQDIIDLRNSTEFLQKARNTHHLNKLLQANNITQTKLQDGRLKIDKKVYSPENLEAVYFYNRSNNKNNLQELKPLIKPYMSIKKNSFNIGSFVSTNNEAISIEKPIYVSLPTVKTNKNDYISMQKKRKGKQYLLKNKKKKNQKQHSL